MNETKYEKTKSQMGELRLGAEVYAADFAAGVFVQLLSAHIGDDAPHDLAGLLQQSSHASIAGFVGTDADLQPGLGLIDAMSTFHNHLLPLDPDNHVSRTIGLPTRLIAAATIDLQNSLIGFDAKNSCFVIVDKAAELFNRHIGGHGREKLFLQDR